VLTSAEWDELRDLARRNVEADRRRRDPDLRLGPVDAAALRAADGWLGPERVADWDWRAVTKRRRDARFDLAIWHAGRLCGLGFGPVEGVLGMGRACLEYVEGAPRPHPLQGRIIPIALLALEEFARIMALPEVRLLGPSRALVPVYEAFGYEAVAGGPGTVYLRKRMVRP
jgi:hypothetical protein